jgi:hypothetical protein
MRDELPPDIRRLKRLDPSEIVADHRNTSTNT